LALRPFLRPYRFSLIGAFLALLIAAAAQLALPVAFRHLIDQAFAERNLPLINMWLLGFLAATVIFGGFAALRFYMVTWVGERVVADLRAAIYRRVVRMDPMFYETTRVGEVLSRLTADTTLVQSIAGVNLSIVLRSALSMTGALALMALTSARLTGVILLLIPLIIAPLILAGRRVRGLSRASQDRIADTSSLADETLNAIQTVQAFTMEQLLCGAPG
jgi:ATP-binding cassette subfamily B protein